MGASSLPKTVTRQRRDSDLNSGLLRLSPACYHSATKPPSKSGVWDKVLEGSTFIF